MNIKVLQLIDTFLVSSCMIRAGVILALTGLCCFVLRIVYRKTIQRVTQSPHFLSVTFLKALYRPLLVFVVGIGVIYSLEWLCLDWQLEAIRLFTLSRKLLVIGLSAWFLWNLVVLYSQVFLTQDIQKKMIDSTLVYALSYIAKIVIIILTALSLFELF